MGIQEHVFQFLKQLANNNYRDWMQENKKQYQSNEKELKLFYHDITNQLNQDDVIDKLKVFRINRDIRFSKDKTPYNVHRSASWSRQGAERRGGYYLRLEPGKSMMACGFFSPEKEDLFRIRKEFEFDASEINSILNEEDFAEAFGGFNSENALKTAPRGFDKNHENINLIKLKSYVVSHHFSDDEVFSYDFSEKVVHHFRLCRPYLDYMTEVLTTNLNGESLL